MLNYPYSITLKNACQFTFSNFIKCSTRNINKRFNNKQKLRHVLTQERLRYLPSTNSWFGWFWFSSWWVGPWLNNYWRTLYSVCSKSENFSSRVCLRSPLVLLRKSIEHQVKRTPKKVATSCTLNAISHMCIAVLPRTCTEHRNITWHIERLSLVTNTWMHLPNLRRSEIDYKFSIVYTWHPESPNHPDSSPRANNHCCIDINSKKKTNLDQLA